MNYYDIKTNEGMDESERIEEIKQRKISFSGDVNNLITSLQERMEDGKETYAGRYAKETGAFISGKNTFL